MANETKPKLYTYQGDQYDYDIFSRDANTGFSDYISQFDFNNDERQYIWDAYSNLLSGIGDGSIIYNNGRLKDLRGRYSNNYYYNNKGERKKSKGANDDYYGLATSYLLGVLGRQQKYEAPVEEKPVWDDVTRQSDLSQLIFNTDNPTDAQLKYFIDTDNLVNGTRGTSERAKIVANALSKYYTKENLLSKGASEEDAAKYSQWAQTAIQRLNDGKIDAGDTYALSRLLPGYDLDALFRSEKQTPEQVQQNQQKNLEDSKRKFAQIWQEKYSSPEGAKKEFDLNFDQYYIDDSLIDPFISILDKLGTNQLQNLLQLGLLDPNFNFTSIEPFSSQLTENKRLPTPMILHMILSKLGNTGHGIKDNEGNIILTDFFDSDNRAGYIYNPKTKILQRVPFSESDYWRKKIFEKETGLKPKQDSVDWIDDYFVQYQKKGGVLKAQNGIKYEDYVYDPSQAVTYNSNLAQQRQMNVLGKDGNWITQNRDSFAENTQNPDNYLYDREAGNPELRGFWGDWTKLLTTKPELAELWATEYIERQRDPKIKEAFQQHWFSNGKFNFENFKTPINRNGITKLVWDDTQNGTGHDFYVGDVYRIKGKEGQPDRWYKGVVEGYKVSNRSLADNRLYRIYDLEKEDVLTPGPTLPTIPKPDVKVNVNIGKKSSNINPTEWQEKSSSNIDWTGILGNLGTDLMGIGRLFGSLRTNNRVHDTLMNSLKPVLRDTYERYSPVTGAFSEMQFRNRQAADLRRRAARPFTSDASLQLAGELDADRQARDLEYQGFLADDREIRRTQQEALARQEDNMKRRSDVANFNRASINQTNKERTELDAARLRNNWQSVDNYLSGVESRFRNRLSQRENREYNARLMLAQNDYQTAVQQYNEKYRQLNPKATVESMLADPKYVRDMQELRNIYQYNMYQLASNQRYSPQFKAPSSYWSILNRKRGGTLLPSTKMLLNKVIRNENNS